MSTSGNNDNGGTAPPANRGTERPVPDRIDFVYDHATEGDVASNDEIKGSDYTTVRGDNTLDTNEIAEVWKVELIPPRGGDGTLQSFDHLRLWDGADYYPNVRYREMMMAYEGPDNHLTTPPLANPVLAGNDPQRDPIGTCTPKYGPSTTISPAIQNDGTAITDSFRVRFHTWRWKGSEQEFQSFISRRFGRTTFPQNITMSNPFTGDSRTYQRSAPPRLERGADGGALGQWTQLTGGVDQSLPKVYPWVTWSENNNATRTNRPYEFTTVNDRVDEDWKALEFDLTDQKEAVRFEQMAVNEPANLLKGMHVIEERDEDPEVQLTPNSAHEYPILRPTDGTLRELHSQGQIPVSLTDLLNAPEVLWDDGGGFRIQDDGTQIAANNILINVYGKRLRLTS